MTVRGTVRLGWVLVLAVIAVGAGGPVSAPAVTPLPAVAFTENDRVTVATADGTRLRQFPAFAAYSLAGGVFAGSRWLSDRRTDELAGYEVESGTLRFRVRNAFAPIVIDGGRKTVFLPD